jgi:hypothetical protein
MNFFDRKDLGNHLLKLCHKVVKHPVYIYYFLISREFLENLGNDKHAVGLNRQLYRHLTSNSAR